MGEFYRRRAMAGSKRKAGYVTPGKRRRVRANLSQVMLPATTAITRVGGRGYLRTGGYYGRYNGRPGDELKFHDVWITDDATSSGGSIAIPPGLLNVELLESALEIEQGTGESQRIGRKITISSIHIRGKITLPSSDSPSSCDSRYRIMVVQDKQNNGAGTLLTGAGGVLQNGQIESFRDLENVNRFRILYDKTRAINATMGYGIFVSNPNPVLSNWTSGQRQVNVNINVRLNLPIEYSSPTGSVTEIRSNNICVFLIGDTSGLSFRGQLRCRFRG